MNPDLGPYCMQYRQPKNIKPKNTSKIRGADDKAHDSLEKGYVLIQCQKPFSKNRDFPRPDLGPNIGPFPNSKMSQNFPKWCISFPIS